jgi:hypothetical protein
MGKQTGSRAGDMLATIKSGEAAARRNLRVQLVLERLTNRPQESGFISQAMQDGIDREPEAFALYEALTGTVLMRSGFLAHSEHMAGCSLDGHVEDFKGIAEIKCPTEGVHWAYLRGGSIPAEYTAQITHNLWITGAEWCDWFSYNPHFPERLRMKLERFERDEAAIEQYQRKALAFLAEVDLEVAAALGMEVLA